MLCLSGISRKAYFMNAYVLLHCEPKNDATTITKLHRTTPLWLVALYKYLTMIVTSFLCSKCNRT